MSKTAGIIDSSTFIVATKSGQMIVKVAPKTEQTHLKIMKKNGASTQQVVQMRPKCAQQTPKSLKGHLAKAKKRLSELKVSPVTPKQTEFPKKPIYLLRQTPLKNRWSSRNFQNRLQNLAPMHFRN
ncbi:unnamed protein product [Diabrotica balteata]|uniref:Uncharacterized protein n=1 Tax=Diabrotica balteata TaxID=107213 RepID=A0A9N9X8A0_DIABA|nr:unnamed protein product [Diabrotica balteata]